MFGIGISELTVIVLIAFFVVGPKDFPKIARMLGKTIRSVRAGLDELQKEMNLEEETKELKEVCKELESVKQSAEQLNPVKLIRQEIAAPVRNEKAAADGKEESKKETVA